jgi:cytochrome c oxidase subunit 1
MIGAFMLGASMLPFVWNVFRSWRYGEPVTVDDLGAMAIP